MLISIRKGCVFVANTPTFQSSISNMEAPSGSVSLVDCSELTKVSVRAGTDTPTGLAMGATFGGSRNVDGVLIAGIRPDEWLVVGEPSATGNVLASIKMEGFAHSIDMTHGRACIRMTGVDAARALEKVCNLDFSDAMTPNGAAVSASVAKVGCDIVRDDVDGVASYLILVDRSFGQYLFDALDDSIQEFSN